MHAVEPHLVVFDTQRGKLVDVEKAPPVDLIVGGAPPSQPIMLPFQQRMQRAQLEYTVRSRAASASLAENYVGLPFDW